MHVLLHKSMDYADAISVYMMCTDDTRMSNVNCKVQMTTMMDSIAALVSQGHCIGPYALA